MAHPYQDKIHGRATAHKRYAEGGPVEDASARIAHGVQTIAQVTPPPKKSGGEVKGEKDNG